MTRRTLQFAQLLAAGTAAAGLTVATGAHPLLTVPVVPVAWFALGAAGRELRDFVIRRRRTAESQATPPEGIVTRADRASAVLHSVASGEPAFVRDDTGLVLRLERAVLFPASPGDEDDVVLAAQAASPRNLTLLAHGVIATVDSCVEALRHPFHPLFDDASQILPSLGVRVAGITGPLRATRSWRRLRAHFEDAGSASFVAIRLLQAGMPRAALAVLVNKPRGASPQALRLRRTLRRLARLAVVYQQVESAALGFPLRHLYVWAAPVVLLGGRRLRDLTPTSPLVVSSPGGPDGLARTVSATPEIVAELDRLQNTFPPVRAVVASVLGVILSKEPREILPGLTTNGVRGRRPFNAAPDRALLLHLRGLALLAERRPGEASGEFEAALLMDQNFTASAYCLALSWERTGEKDRAVSLLRAFEHEHPNEAEATVFLARFLADRNDRYGARRAYREGVKRHPESSPLRMAFASDLQRWGDEAEAAEQLDAVRKSEPRDPRLALIAGRAQLSAGRPADAVEPLEQAKDRLHGRERAEAVFLLIAAFREQGRHEKALALADDAMRSLGRSQVDMLEDLAEYLEERRDYRRARRAASRARRLRGNEW